MNNKPENRIPWLLTDFDNIKDFPWLLKKFFDFSLTFNNFRFLLTFPWHILIWDFFSTFWGIFCYFRQASCDGVRFQASYDHFRRTNWTEDWARLTLWTMELWGLVTMVAKFLDLNNCSWQRRPFAFSNDGRKVWATMLIQSAIIHRSHACHFYRFFSSCYICRTTACWDPEILPPWQRDVTASPLSWHVTTKIWVVLLVGSNKFNQEHFPDLGSDVSSCSTDFLRSFLGRYFAGKSVVASPGGHGGGGYSW